MERVECGFSVMGREGQQMDIEAGEDISQQVTLE